MLFFISIVISAIFVACRQKTLSMKNANQLHTITICLMLALAITGSFVQQTNKIQIEEVSPSYDSTHSGTLASKSGIQAGDILLYRELNNRNTKIIRFFERREHHHKLLGYYHVAIALDGESKIEANGKKVTIKPIDYGHFDVFRPPIPLDKIHMAIDCLKGFSGQSYDWWLITDDILRYFTNNAVHLPTAFIEVEEQNKKTCSSLVSSYFSATKWGRDLSLNASPEDIYGMLKLYRVADISSKDGYPVNQRNWKRIGVKTER